MKNVEIDRSGTPFGRVNMKGALPPHGWFIRYLSGIEGAPEVKVGYWLVRWDSDTAGYAFEFGPGLDLSFDTEAKASEVSAMLRESMAIETEVVEVPRTPSFFFGR